MHTSVARATHYLPDLIPTPQTTPRADGFSLPNPGYSLAVSAEVFNSREHPRSAHLDVVEMLERAHNPPSAGDLAPLHISHEPLSDTVSGAVSANDPGHSLAHFRASEMVARLLWSFGLKYQQEFRNEGGEQVVSYTLDKPRQRAGAAAGPAALRIREGLHVFGDPLSLAAQGLAVAFVALNKAGAGSVVEYTVRNGNFRRFGQT